MERERVSDEGYREIIAPGAFGDEPKTVPLRFGQGGPIIGTATVNPDGTVTAAVMKTEPQLLRDQADTQAGNFGEPIDGGCPVCGTPVEHHQVDVTTMGKPPGTEFVDGRWYCPKGHASAPWVYGMGNPDNG
jgi:hypothetical protein